MLGAFPLKKLLFATLALFAIANTALADSIIVVRPAIGSGTAGVLPQAAFPGTSTPSNPTTPTNPTNPATPTGPTVFSSIGFNSGGTTGDIEGTVGVDNEYAMPWGNPYCEVVDSSGKSLKSRMTPAYYQGFGSNTPAIMFKPNSVGVYKIVVSCGQSSQSHSPAVQFNLTVT
jgi:hypothetical protein